MNPFEKRLLIAIAAASVIGLGLQLWIVIDRLRIRRKFRRLTRAGSGE